VIFPALIAALFITAFLYGIARRPDEAGNSLGAALTLLLLAPGGLAIFAVRPAEPRVTTNVLTGLRILGGVAASMAFIACGVLVLAQRWKTVDSRQVPNGLADGWHSVLWGVTIVAFLATATLLRAFWLTRRPPEQNLRLLDRRRRSRERRANRSKGGRGDENLAPADTSVS
jgi:hypothetical protein